MAINGILTVVVMEGCIFFAPLVHLVHVKVNPYK
jgi:hypothetical protein